MPKKTLKKSVNFDKLLGGRGSVKKGGSEYDKRGASSVVSDAQRNIGDGSFGALSTGKLKIGGTTEVVIVKDLSFMDLQVGKGFDKQAIRQAMADMELVAGMSVCSTLYPCADAPVVTYKGSAKLVGNIPGAATEIFLEPVFWDGKKKATDVRTYFGGEPGPREAWANFASWASPISPAGGQLFNLDAALVFAQQLLLGLGFLEARAALRHHDLWHANIMFGDGGLVKIIDLGIPCQYNPGKDAVLSGFKAYSNGQCTYNSVAFGAFNLACASPMPNDDGQGCKRGRAEARSPVIDALCDSDGKRWGECQINPDCNVKGSKGTVLGRFASASIDLYPTGLVLFDFILGAEMFSFSSLFISTVSQDKIVTQVDVRTSLLPHFLSLSDGDGKQQKMKLPDRARVQARMAAIITHSLHERGKKPKHIFPQAPVAALFANNKAMEHCIAVFKGARNTLAFGKRNTAGACEAVANQKLAEEAAYAELVGDDKGVAELVDLLANLLTPGTRPGLELKDAADPMFLSNSIDSTRSNIAKKHAGSSAEAVSSCISIYATCMKKTKKADPDNVAKCRAEARLGTKRQDFEAAVAAVTTAFNAPSQTQIIHKGPLPQQIQGGSTENNALGGVALMTNKDMEDAAAAGTAFVDWYNLARKPAGSTVLAAAASVTKNNHKPMRNYLWSEGATGGTKVRHVVLTATREGKHILSVYQNVAKDVGMKKKKKKNPIAAQKYTLELLHNGELFGADNGRKALSAQGQLCDKFIASNRDNGYLETRVRGRRKLPAPRPRAPLPPRARARAARYLRAPRPPFPLFCAQVSDKCGPKKQQGIDTNCFCFALRDDGGVDRILRLRFGTDSANAPTPTFVKVAQEVSQAQVVQPPRR